MDASRLQAFRAAGVLAGSAARNGTRGPAPSLGLAAALARDGAVAASDTGGDAVLDAAADALDDLPAVGVTPDGFDALFGDLDLRAPAGHRRLAYDDARAAAAALRAQSRAARAAAVDAVVEGCDAAAPRRAIALLTAGEVAGRFAGDDSRPASRDLSLPGGLNS